jgi:predicted patatin/cPLA2 family phospholipase
MDQPETPGTTTESQDLLWTARLRGALSRDKGAAPALCIQGGGAKGAWEAGVLARLLKAGHNTAPSSIWGTSAGALNALWSRDPEVSKEPVTLLCYWMMLARRLIIAAISSMVGLICFVFFFFSLPFFLKTLVAALTIFFFGFLYVSARRRKLVRLPGLIPSNFVRLIVPKPRSIATGFSVYTCVSNVDSKTRPEFWDRSGRGWFVLKGSSSVSSAEELGSGECVDAFRVAVASASLPVIVQPTRLAGMTLLDGGLVANLPGGFILSNGALGGAYVLCIIPRCVSEFVNSDPIDNRTLRFLHDLRDQQAKYRIAAAGASSSSGPAHTHIPVFVFSPRQRLKSGLIWFWPPLLRREFWQGYQEAKIFSDSLDAFRQGEHGRISEFLLEHVVHQSDALVEQPSRPFWYMWANTSW